MRPEEAEISATVWVFAKEFAFFVLERTYAVHCSRWRLAWCSYRAPMIRKLLGEILMTSLWRHAGGLISWNAMKPDRRHYWSWPAVCRRLNAVITSTLNWSQCDGTLAQDDGAKSTNVSLLLVGLNSSHHRPAIHSCHTITLTNDDNKLI